jgi:hypothetical protein
VRAAAVVAAVVAVAVAVAGCRAGPWRHVLSWQGGSISYSSLQPFDTNGLSRLDCGKRRRHVVGEPAIIYSSVNSASLPEVGFDNQE